MRATVGGWWMAASLGLACSPVPSEVTTESAEGSAGASTGATSTSGATTPGQSSASASGLDGSGGATGHDTGPMTTGGATTEDVLPGTSTGAGDGPGGTSPSDGGNGSSTSPSGGGSTTSVEPIPTCDDLYGMAPGYLLCMESETECRFNATTGGGNCNALCAMYGGTCNDALDNSTDCMVIRPDMDDCNTNRSTEICVCSK